MATGSRPRVGISRCLAGDRVRYDGASSRHKHVAGRLASMFELVLICPEVEAGLGIPRPPVQLTACVQLPRRLTPTLAALDGFVFKSRSPSCGLHSTPVFIDGICVTETASGVFARSFREAWPDTPVIEESGLDSAQQRQHFIEQVRTCARLKTATRAARQLREL